MDNLFDYSILLGTDYGHFTLNKVIQDSSDILKYYISNEKNYKNIISSEQHEKFNLIKKYYTDEIFSDEFNKFLENPVWNKPNFMDLKKRLLELDVDEDYIDKKNYFLDMCYNNIKNRKILKNLYNDSYNNLNSYFRSYSFDNKKYNDDSVINLNTNFKSYSFDNKKYLKNKINNEKYNFDTNYFKSNNFKSNDLKLNKLFLDLSIDTILSDDKSKNNFEENTELYQSSKIDNGEIFYLEN